MATAEDDISILSSPGDYSDGYIDEADILAKHFAINPLIHSEDTASLQVFRNAFEDLKTKYNGLYIKSENQAKKLKELESRKLSISSSDSQTGSFLLVNDSNMDNCIGDSQTEIAVLNGKVKELQRKLMRSDLDNKTLQAEKSQLENTLKTLKNIDENKSSLESQEISHLKEKTSQLEQKHRSAVETISMLTEKIQNLESKKLESRSTFITNQEFVKLKEEYSKLREENLQISKDLRKNTEDFVALKRKAFAAAESADRCDMILSNGMSAPMALANGVGASREVVQQISDLSLNSSLPAAQELDQLKHVIKKLKHVVQSQNAVLVKLDENPAIRKILRGENLTFAQESLRKGLNSGISCGMEARGSNSHISNRENPADNVDYGQRHQVMGSNFKAISRSEPTDMLTTDDSYINFTTSRQQTPTQLQVRLPEHYDNVPEAAARNLRQYQSKSQSEMITRQSQLSPRNDLQRSHSLSNREALKSPVFENESARIVYDRSHVSPYNNTRPGSTRSSTAIFPPIVGAAGRLSPPCDPNLTSVKTCPVCSANFTYSSVSDFQDHVFNCVDAEEQPSTLTCESGPERICPMCNHMFPASCPQIEVDNHVNAHFGEAPADAFEIINN